MKVLVARLTAPAALGMLALVLVMLAAAAACRAPETSPLSGAQAAPVQSDTRIVGRVVGVTDGDTITVLFDGSRQEQVRLAQIDAPESGQPWGARAKQALSDRVFGQDVGIERTDTDRYGRTVAQVHIGERDINREMVAIGAAWAFRRYLTDDSLIEIEARARREGLGLWSMPASEIIAPWEWRDGVRVQAAPVPQIRPLLSTPRQGTAAGFSCGKRRCGEMSSCAEARFHLEQCSVHSLDGDGDGTPCDSLCG